MQGNKNNLIWIDLEMTGLDVDNDLIIEIATIVTDSQLDVLAEGPALAIHQDLSILKAMDSWNTRQHSKSGLWQRVLDSATSVAIAESKTIEFLRDYVDEGVSPMCGNSICQDRRFLYRCMPELESFFHYRHIDVSTIKELAMRWCPDIMQGFSKESKHLALSDITDSIDELKYYRQHLGKFSRSQR